MGLGLAAHGSHDRVAEEPAAENEGTAAAQQNDSHDHDDHGCVVLFGFFR